MDRYEHVRKSTDRIKKYGREKLKSKHTRPDCRLHGGIVESYANLLSVSWVNLVQDTQQWAFLCEP